MRLLAKILLTFIAISFLAIAFFVSLILYSWKIEPTWIETTRNDVKFANYPADTQPLKIALVGDIHFGPLNRDVYVRRVVKEINRTDPDIVLLAGDFVTDEKYIAPLAGILQGLKAKRGKFAVFGGHDYQYKRNVLLEKKFDEVGIHVLKNNNMEIYKGVRLISVDDAFMGKPDSVAAFAGVPERAVKIVVTHDPKIFPRLKDMNCVVLTAHTHAGQIDFPGIPRNQIPGLLRSEYIRGWYHDGNSRLYVNRGIGTVFLYMRFRARPEISLFTFSKGKPDYTGMKKKDRIDPDYPTRRFFNKLIHIMKHIQKFNAAS